MRENLITTQFIMELPKAELHVHFDGTIEPELFLRLAERNKVAIPFTTVEAARAAYVPKDFDSFVTMYHTVTSTLKKDEDFYDVMYAYLRKAASQGVRHAEVLFDTQTYTPRGISADAFITSLYAATQDAEKQYGITSCLILCFLRHLSEAEALHALEEATCMQRDKIVGIGLATAEKENPPQKFMRLFARARAYGYRLTAHAGEGTSAQYVRDTIKLLAVERIDHGVSCWEDAELVAELVARQLPLTVCPLSNVALGVYPSLAAHPLRKMLQAGLLVSIHSDDPPYFGGYIADNYRAVYEALGLTRAELIQCARNSFISSFLPEAEKMQHLAALDYFLRSR